MPATDDEPNFEIIEPSTVRVLEILLKDQNLTLVDVNFPEQTPLGLRWTRQSVRHYDHHVVQAEAGQRQTFLVQRRPGGRHRGGDRPLGHRKTGYVSMTPLRLDLTNETELAAAATRHPLK